MKLELSEPQLDFVTSKAPATAMVSGFGAGKSFAGTTCVLTTLLQNPGIDQLYCAPTIPLIRDIFYPLAEEFLDQTGIRYNVNKGENIIHVQGYGKVFCKTMERPERLVGFSVGDALLDELDILPTEKAIQVVRKVSARLRLNYKRPGKDNQLRVSTTPEGFKACYELFKKNPMEGSRLIHASTMSNAHNLPDTYITNLRNQYPEELIDAYLEGKFVNLTSGTVYYSFDRFKHNTHYVARPREILHVGMDFNVYNMAAVICVKREGVKYAVGELVGLRDTPDMIEALREGYPDHPIFVYPDATGKNASSKGSSLTDHKLLKEAKFKLKVRSKNPLVKDRVQSWNRQIEAELYKVNTEKCPELTASLEQQIYNTNGEPDKENGLDHILDAGGYENYYANPIIKHNVNDAILGGF